MDRRRDSAIFRNLQDHLTIKDASSIQKREQTKLADKVADFPSAVRSVNKPDSAQLVAQFSSLKQVMAASGGRTINLSRTGGEEGDATLGFVS